ncbi:hypothetical protein TYRP_012913 [Tyrophagus putrescentiae]|nr:hypothetical protein TYRP_012913 [Tyrophagus putrescentiae]
MNTPFRKGKRVHSRIGESATGATSSATTSSSTAIGCRLEGETTSTSKPVGTTFTPLYRSSPIIFCSMERGVISFTSLAVKKKLIPDRRKTPSSWHCTGVERLALSPFRFQKTTSGMGKPASQNCSCAASKFVFSGSAELNSMSVKMKSTLGISSPVSSILFASSSSSVKALFRLVE